MASRSTLKQTLNQVSLGGGQKSLVLYHYQKCYFVFCLSDSYRDYYYQGEDLRRLPRSNFKRTRRKTVKEMVSGWTLAKISLFLCVTSLFLQILGFSCPGWMVLTIDLAAFGDALGSGLFGFGKIWTYAAVWYVKVCVLHDLRETCSSSSHHDSNFMGLHLSNALSGRQGFL